MAEGACRATQDKHTSIASGRVAGTGAKFVCEIQAWLKAKKVPTFIAHGSPGVGKTYLACAVISQHLQQPLEEIDDLAYIYFTYDDRDRQTPLLVYVSIVLQLLRGSSKIGKELSRLYEERRKITPDQILVDLKRVVAALESSKFLILDALDEASEEMREDVLDLLEGARSDSPRILVTSRKDYGESLPYEQVLSLHVHANGDDITAFSENRLNNRNVKRIIKAKYGTGDEAQQFTSKISKAILNNSHRL